MPEQNIQKIVGRAVTSPKFAEILLDPDKRESVLSRYGETELTSAEREAMMAIKAGSVAEFAQGCIDAGIVSVKFKVPSKSSRL